MQCFDCEENVVEVLVIPSSKLTLTSSSWKCFFIVSIIWSAREHRFAQNSAEVELAPSN